MKTSIKKFIKNTFVFSVFLFSIYLPITFIFTNENISGNTNNLIFATGKLAPALTNASDPTKFMIGLIHNGFNSELRYDLLTESLLCNTWHIYGRWTRDTEWYMGDTLYAPISDYKSYIIKTIQDNENHNMRTLFMREKMLYLCFGQRSDYQCEKGNLNADVASYSYSAHDSSVSSDYLDNTVFGSNKTWVRYSSVQYNDTGYVCKGLRSNREQINKHSNWGAYAVDSLYKWYVRPRIRIDSAFASNPINQEKNVCRIEVLNFKGDTILCTNIKVRHFNDGNNIIYHGNYLDTFFFTDTEPNLIIDTNKKFNPDQVKLWEDGCNVDFRVFWYKECDMWIDYVRVENQTAKDLYNHAYDDSWLDWEVNQIAVPNSNNLDRFYIEEFEFNQIPCMKYVSDFIKSKNSNFSLMFDLNIPTYSAFKDDSWNFCTPEHIKRNLYDVIQPKEVFSFSYPLKGKYINQQNQIEGEAYIPNTLPGPYLSFAPDSGRLADPVSPSYYDQKLQQLLDFGGTDCNRNLLQSLYDVSKETGKPIIFMPQGHMVYWEYHILKEPTNEEISLLTNIALTYGAKGILHYAYGGGGCYTKIANDANRIGYDRGFTDPKGNNCEKIGDERIYNSYGQKKWEGVRKINEHLVKWGDYLRSFIIGEGESYTYYIEGDRNSFLSNTYFNELVTYKLSSAKPECDETNDYPYGGYQTYPECKEYRYIQTRVFNISNDMNQYFMIVNRRCSPFVETTSEDNNGGRRLVKIKFDVNSSSFAGYNNWKIVDLYNDSTILTFDKNAVQYLDLGWYMPGEAKLYKITPVILNGGTLVADETLSGNINCNGKIYNNGYNITINEGTVITFSDTAGIEMDEGTLTCGVNADNVDAVTLQKTTNGSGWNGLVLNNCPDVGIYNTNFSGIKANDTAKAVLISNCGNVYFRKNNFTPSNNAGAIQTFYTSPSFDSLSFRVQECNFYMEQSGYSGISIISNASMTIPIVIEWCTFNTSSDTSNAILMNNITGGAIKNSNLIGFKKSIVALGSAIDIYGNRIIGCNSSYGIQCLSGSDLKLKTVSGYYLGGENYIRNYGTSSSCIYSDNSLFDINNGENHFDLNDTVDSKFLTGTLGGVPSDNVDAAKNCFHLDSINNIEANHTMTWYGMDDPVSFTFIAYSCELTQPQDYMVFNYGGYNDTVYYNPGGEGIGFNPNKAVNMQKSNYKSLRDTINFNLRKRNYAVVEDKAKQLLTQYPDSLESIGMVQKLYIASLTLDQNGNKIGQLKSYLENLISSNQQNAGLTKRAFYHIQKCKVKLGQYQSALDGFQYIMTQNSYSYEGLVASWDYAATYLLMGQGGSLSGDTEQMTEELSTPADTLLNRMSRNDSKTKTGSDGQKTKIFYEKVKTAAKDDRTRREEKVKQLEKTIETSKSDAAKTQAKTELATMKTIKESVKIRKPNSVRTHIAIVNSDIKKIFGIGKSTSSNTKNNLIPTSFELHQNYPNPFNPSTKIAFDLPKDAKVKLVIYDILGREIKTLIHNEFRAAGKYITEFNGSNLASGVYFYRLQAGDFVSVKKMVLIK